MASAPFPQNAEHLRHEIKLLGLTQIAVSSAVKASQSQVSRVLSGQTSMKSRLAQDICIYVSSKQRRGSPRQIASNTDLMDAIASVWDGTPSHARAMAAVIRSLKLLSPAEPK